VESSLDSHGMAFLGVLAAELWVVVLIVAFSFEGSVLTVSHSSYIELIDRLTEVFALSAVVEHR
jgi:hypothetical protein